MTKTRRPSSEKRCSKCGAIKPLADFYKHKQSVDGLRPDCKACVNVRTETYRVSHRSLVNQTARARYHAQDGKREQRLAGQRHRYHTTIYGRVLDTPEDIIANEKDRFRHARVLGYRSGLEVRNAQHFKSHGFDPAYEKFKVKYTVPERIASYSPDFVMDWNGIVVETKGIFQTADRHKHLLIKGQFPDLEVRFVFTNPNSRISKTSPTSYAMWCEKHGFKYAKLLTPVAWLHEDPEPKRMEAMRLAFGITLDN